MLRRRVEPVDRQVDVLVGRECHFKILPPRVQETLSDDAEPRGPQGHLARQLLVAAAHGRTQLVAGDPSEVPHLIRVRLQCQGLARPELVQQQVVDLVLAPRGTPPVRYRVRCPVVHAGDELEARHIQLGCRDPELMPELPHGRVLDAGRVACGNGRRRVDLRRQHAMQRVAAARVRPDVGERHLGRRSLLQQKPLVSVEEHHREGAVQDAPGLA
mmetsp:Transcript_75258/g.243346  ORF Transcript_75258/g.243346 Transcript_75258/m.243346 type:complete len:215 (-) Transcript_75258:251-895(-)